MDSLFDDLPEPEPARARLTDPGTSHAAAASITLDKLRESQRAVLTCFEQFGPMHHDALVHFYTSYPGSRPRQSPSGLRTRTKELVTAGLIEDSGSVVVLPSGRKSIVWRRVEQ